MPVEPCDNASGADIEFSAGAVAAGMDAGEFSEQGHEESENDEMASGGTCFVFAQEFHGGFDEKIGLFFITFHVDIGFSVGSCSREDGGESWQERDVEAREGEGFGDEEDVSTAKSGETSK